MNSTDFFKLGRAANCPKDQLLNFARARIHLQPKQLAASAAARLCDQPDGPTEIGFGGARGGGESHWLLAQIGADDCQRLPGLKCLLLRKVGKANLGNFEDLRRRVLPQLPHLFVSSKNTLTFDNGSRIIAGHYQHESDIDAYLGLEYDLIAIEEPTTLTYRKYHNRNDEALILNDERSPNVRNPNSSLGFPSSLVISASLLSPSTLFIPATIADNAHINPEYTQILNLNEPPPALTQRERTRRVIYGI